MKTIITIAVRMKSKRLPNKAMAEIAGRPLIYHLIERVKKAKLPSQVVLCTSHLQEDQILLQEAKKCGVRPFAGSPEDVFERFLAVASQEGARHVVRVTGDNPLTDPVVIDRLMAHHIKSDADYTAMDGLPLGVGSEVISVEALKKAQMDLQDRSRSEYMTFLLKDLKKYRVEMLKADEKIRRPQYRLTVDTPEDLELMKIIFSRFYGSMESFSLESVIQFLDHHSDRAAMNRNIEQRSTFNA